MIGLLIVTWLIVTALAVFQEHVRDKNADLILAAKVHGFIFGVTVMVIYIFSMLL